MNDISFLFKLLELDYDFKIITEDGQKTVYTKYGKYYLTNFTSDGLFDCIVFLKAQELLSYQKNDK